jgi:hypothetical protein
MKNTVADLSRSLAAELARPEPKLVVKPGLYRRGELNYDRIAGHNFSTLKFADKSPRHYRHRLTSPPEEKLWMRRGTAAHTAVLEPDRFLSDYAMFDGKTRRGKAWDAFCTENEGKQIITRAEHLLAMGVRDSVRGDEVAGPYFRDGFAEVTIIWTDEETGLLCRCRCDWLSPGDYLIDLKGSGDVRPRWFGRTGGRMLYHAQAAFYHDGYKAVTGRAPSAKLVAVEPTAPHDVVVYRVLAEQIDAGRQRYREWLIAVAEAERTGRYPGIGRGLEQDFQLPQWELEDENEIDSLELEM